MILSNSKQYIFIHNFKVAGQSIAYALYRSTYPYLPLPHIYMKARVFLKNRSSLFPSQIPDHITLKDLKNRIKPEIFSSYYKFGFVRNPWDWQISLYTYALNNPRHFKHEFIKSLKNFDEYIDWRVNSELFLQKQFFYNDDDECLANFIGKKEHLNHDFQKICSVIGINAELPHLNQSRKGPGIEKYYSQETINIVEEAFKDDIEAFSYQKPKLHANTMDNIER